jgi:hypothetical protein
MTASLPPDWLALNTGEIGRLINQGVTNLAVSLQMQAVAYVNCGRWVADCPRPHCNNAIALTSQPRQTMYHCAGEDGCHVIAEVNWPNDADEIWDALQQRPVPATRNWAPAGHRQAVACGVPDGQTVSDLHAETKAHEVT